MQPSQVIILVSVLFGLGGLLLGFLLGSAWANRQHRSLENEEAAPELELLEEEPTEPPALAMEPPLPVPAPPLAPPAESSVAAPAQPTAPPPAEPPAAPQKPGPQKPIPAAPAAFPAEPVPPSASKKPAAPLSIIEQVNAIFRQMTAGTPLAERSISLQQDPTLGVTVLVGVEHFNSIEEVPDEEIRAALKAAVKKWEETS